MFFVNEDSHRINQIADACRLDIVQLHGNEDDDFCKKIILPRWKSIGVKDPSSLEQISSYRHIDGIILDTYHKGVSGGTGKTFRWDLVKDISKEQFLILAGGLNPDNIIAAMTEVNPHVLDVNSGVETHLIKDEYKVKALFNQINRH